MTPAKRVARNLLWLGFGDAFSRGGVFLYAILVARSLGPEAFGVFALAQGTALYAWIGVDLGVNLYGAREVARAGDDWEAVVSELFGLRLAASAVMALLYATGAVVLAPDLVLPAMVVSCTYLVTNALSLDWAAKGMDRFHLPALGNAASATVALLGYAMLVRHARDPATAVGVWGGAYLAGAAVLFLALARGKGRLIKPSFRLAAWRGHLSASLWFAASGALLSAMQYAPVLALTLRGGFDDIGQFSAAARLILVAMSAGFLLPMACYPTLSRKAKEADGGVPGAARRLQITMAALGTLGGAALYVTAGSVVELLYGAEYAASANVLRALAWVVPVVSIRASVGSVLLASGLQARHSLAASAGLVVTAAGCLLFVPPLGTIGAAWAWFAGELVVAAAMASAWIQARERTYA